MSDGKGDPCGRLVAVAGLCGGAGASTLAYLLARAVAESTQGPVLACDTGGATAGLAALAGAETPRTLPEAAAAIASGGGAPDGLFAELGDGLRLIAAGPRIRQPEGATDGIVRLLSDARAAHELTVLDCGVPAGLIEQRGLACASAVIWVVPARNGAVKRGGDLLRRLASDSQRRELLVARSDARGGKPPIPELTALAAERRAPLVLMPELPVSGRAEGGALDVVRPALDAITNELRR